MVTGYSWKIRKYKSNRLQLKKTIKNSRGVQLEKQKKQIQPPAIKKTIKNGQGVQLEKQKTQIQLPVI